MAEEKKDVIPAEWGEAQEVESNWKKFEKVGDNIKGTLVNKRFQKGEAPFGDQWVYELKTEDGNIWNVPVSAKKAGTVQRLNSLKLGTITGIVFHSEGESAVKGGHKAKNLKVVQFGMDDTYVLGGTEVEESDPALPDFGS